MQIKFTVLGEPKPKARVKFNSRTGTTYTPKDTVIYENLVKTEYLRQCPGQRFPDKEPLEMRIKAYYAIPASASKKKQAAMEAGEIRPVKTPDADNIIKAVADSLNQVAYHDDAEIVSVSLAKYYGRQPRVEVEIKKLEVMNHACTQTI